jgi:hypothetical protein
MHISLNGRSPTSRQRGVSSVEFSIVAILFFMLVFGVIELCRIIYMYNTLAEVTRRAASAAANANFRDIAKLDSIRQDAIFLKAAGTLPFGDPVTDQNVRIDYLSLANSGGTLSMTPFASGALPACPGQNRQNCLVNQYGANCIRLVRARICATGGAGDECTPVQYQPLFSLINFSLSLPISTTIAPAGSLGYAAGDPICN